MLRDGTCLAVTGSFAPFKEVGAYHLRALLRAAGVTEALEDKADAILGRRPQALAPTNAQQPPDSKRLCHSADSASLRRHCYHIACPAGASWRLCGGCRSL